MEKLNRLSTALYEVMVRAGAGVRAPERPFRPGGRRGGGSGATGAWRPPGRNGLRRDQPRRGHSSRPIAALGLGRCPDTEEAGAHACETGAGVGLPGRAPRENTERAHATSIGNRSPNTIANSARAWDQKPWGRCHFRSIFRSVR